MPFKTPIYSDIYVYNEKIDIIKKLNNHPAGNGSFKKTIADAKEMDPTRKLRM